MKPEKSPGLSGVSLEFIAASGEVVIQVMAEICKSHRLIWNASCVSIVVLVFKGTGDIRNCSCY